jgi:hypothetical protein
MSDLVNYPDILGAITGGARCNIGVVQAALAVRPRVARAGRPFEIILLLQNACDVDVDVTTTLHLPEEDGKKQYGKFVTKNRRIVIGMAPAEVGYVVLPATTLPDTAPGDSYRVDVDIDAKPLQKPRRVREPEGGGEFSLEYLKPDAREKVENLQTLAFSTVKRLGRNTLEAPLSLMSGTLGQIVNFKPGWVSVCRLVDYADTRPLLHHYGDLLRTSILPALRRNELYPQLLQATKAKFTSAGFPLQETEAVLITKLMVLILEYASPSETGHGYIAAGKYGVMPLIERSPLTLEAPPELPRWLTAMLQHVNRDARLASHAVTTVTDLLYEDLLYDAAMLSFELVERETGEDLGGPEELEGYVRTLLNMIKDKAGLHFSQVYLPLIMGGIIVNDQLPVSKQSPADLLRSQASTMEARAAVLGDEEAALIEMTGQLIERTGQKYGFRPG